MNPSEFSELQAVVMIILIGSLFGVGWQLGRETTASIINKFKRPVTVNMKHKDNSQTSLKLTSEQAYGFKKCLSLLTEREENKHDESK